METLTIIFIVIVTIALVSIFIATAIKIRANIRQIKKTYKDKDK